MLFHLCAISLLLAIVVPLPAQETPGSDLSRSGVDAGQHSVAPVVEPNAPELANKGGRSDDMDLTVPIPNQIAEVGPALTLGSELGVANYMLLGVSVGTSFDDNALLTNSNRISNYSYSVFPHIALKQLRARAQWWLSYEGGVNVNQQVTSLNQGSHNATFESVFRLTPHVNFRVNDDFYFATGVFDQLSNQSTSFGQTLQEPNPSVNTPLARRMRNITSSEIDYQFSPRNLIGASGGFYDLHFSEVAGSVSLFNTSTASGSLFFAHHFSPKHSIGVSYTFQKIKLGSGTSDTVAHGLLAFDRVSLAPRITLSLFVGPQISITHSFPNTNGSGLVGSNLAVVSQQQWSPGGGASFEWNGNHTGISIGYLRAIRDGGGALAAVELQNANVAVRRQLARTWTARVVGNYGNNNSLDPLLDLRSVKGAWGKVTVEHRLPANLFVTLGYVREFQKEYDKGFTSRGGNRDVVLLTLSYQFVKPWGR